MVKTTAKNGSLVKSGLRLSLMTFASRILGLLREMTKAAFLGTGSLADSFNFAFAMPNFFRRLFAENSVSVAFIPTFRAYIEDMKTDEDKRTTQEFISATLTLVTFLTALVTAAGMIFTPYIIRLFYSAENTAAIPETTLLTRIMFPYLLVISIAALLQGILNGENIFSPSGFTPVLFNSIVIGATYLLTPHMKNPARAMAIGVISGGIVQVLFQLPFVFKTGWRIPLTSIKKSFSNPGTRRVVSLILPTIIGMAAYQANDFVSASLAGRAGTGVYSSIQYSLRLQELILGIFAVSISTVILPDLSGLARRKEWDAFSKMLTDAMRLIALIAIPVTFYSVISGRDIIALLFKTHNFTDESVDMTLGVFRWHIAGLFFIALNRILAPAFYAQSNTKLPTLAGIINFITNMILAFALVGPMKGQGIALALSAASFINTAFLFIFMTRLHSVNTGSLVKSLLKYSAKIILFSAAAAVPVYFLRPILLRTFTGHNRLISFGMPVLITAVLFAAIGVILLVATHDEIAAAAIKKFSRRTVRQHSK